MPAAPNKNPPPNAHAEAAIAVLAPTFICHFPTTEADNPSMRNTVDIGNEACISVQSAAAGATNPISLVATSAMMDHAQGDPKHMWVPKAGNTISHLDLNSGEAILDRKPNTRSNKPLPSRGGVIVEVGS